MLALRSVILASALLLACKADEPDGVGPASGAGFEPAPARMVGEDVTGPIGTLPPEPPDARPADVATGDVPAPEGAICNPLAQDCPPNQACYPDNGGVGKCARSGPISIHQECLYNTDCARGLACFVSACGKFCDTRMMVTGCEPGERCKLITGFAYVGYCGK